MTQQIGTWRVQYRPGDWIVLSGPTSLVVLQPAAGESSELVTVLWEQVVASATIADLSARLASYGVDTMPSFAALFWHTDGLRSLVRGDISLTDLSTGSTVARGADVVTWSEAGLAGVDHLEVVLPPPAPVGPAAGALPLVVGAVRASSVVLDARTAALVSSPQDTDSPGREDPAGAHAASGAFPSPDVLPVLELKDPIESSDASHQPASIDTEAHDLDAGRHPDPDPAWPADLALEPDCTPDASGGPLLDDQPDTEPFDVSSELDDAPNENEDADTELMALPLTAALAPVETPSPFDSTPVEDDDENAHTELMDLPAANQSPDPEPSPPQVPTPEDLAPVVETQELAGEVTGWPSDPEVSGLDARPGTVDGSLIMAVTCPRLHPNPPPAGFCRICGEAIARQGPRLVSRPLLARLRGPHGDTVDLDRPVRIGRAPSPDGAADQRLMTVMSPSQDISRTHLEIAPDGWQVVVTDLHSTNGTLLVSSDGGMGPHPLGPGEPIVLELGAVLELGDGVTIVIDPPPDL